MSRLSGENLKKKSFYFFEFLPFANLDIENLISQKTVTARSFKLGQFIEDNSGVKNWYQFFTFVKNEYQFFTSEKNRTSPSQTARMHTNSSQLKMKKM